jgi:hypothetical protein
VISGVGAGVTDAAVVGAGVMVMTCGVGWTTGGAVMVITCGVGWTTGAAVGAAVGAAEAQAPATRIAAVPMAKVRQIPGIRSLMSVLLRWHSPAMAIRCCSAAPSMRSPP